MTTTPQQAPPTPSPETTGEDRPGWYRRNRRTLATGAGLTALFILVSIVMTFPQPYLWRAGTPGDFGDQFLIQWLLKWDFHGLVDGTDSILHPNIFWPHRRVLLYSDTELAIAPIAGVVTALAGWTVGYNLLYLSGWVISLASAYVLARWLGASRPASVLTGLIFSFAAVRLGHYLHFQLQFAYLVPLTLWLLLKFFEEKKWWQPVAIGLACAAAFLNAGYIAVVLYPALAIVAGGWLLLERFRVGWKVWAGFAVIAVIGAVLCYPIVRQYAALGTFLRRPYDWSAVVIPKSFVSPPERSWLYGWLEDLTKSTFENRLFPGFLPMALGVVGAVALWKTRMGRRRPAPAAAAVEPATTLPAGDLATVRLRRRGLFLILIASTVPLILSFGSYQIVFGRSVPLPFKLVQNLPGFGAIRAWGRFTVVPLLSLGLVVAFAFDWLVRSRSAVTRVAVATVLGAVMLAEYRSHIFMSPRIDLHEYTAVNKALADLPRGPVVELPMADNHQPTWAYIEAPRMLLSTIDWQPRVNGYSGYSPPDYETSVRLFNTLDDGPPASEETLARLDKFGIQYLIIRSAPLDRDQSLKDRSFVDDETAARMIAALPPERVESVAKHGSAWLVQLHPGPNAGSSTSRP
ncbi:MAG: hypothetical protein ACRD2W_01915 [Acidimicrobiales bacterium]